MAIKSKSVKPEVLRKWRDRVFHVSYIEIAEATGLSRNTIGNTIRTGYATPETIEKLTNFFNNTQIPA